MLDNIHGGQGVHNEFGEKMPSRCTVMYFEILPDLQMDVIACLVCRLDKSDLDD